MNYKPTQKSEAPVLDWPKKSDLGNRLVGSLIAMVIALAIINLIGTNALATQGVVLDQILTSTEKITKENRILMIEIGKKANLSYIQSAAANLGFVRVKGNLIISLDEALAAAR